MFKKPTVDSILSAFSKTVAALRDCAAANEAEADRQSDIAAAAHVVAGMASHEASRAHAAANRIENLLS